MKTSFDEPGPAAFADGHRPCKEKEGFDIEDHEQHRDQIEFGGQAQAGAADGQHAGFEGFVLARPQALLPSRLDRPSMKAHRPTTPRRKMAKPQLWAMSPAESDMLEILIQRPSSAV